RTLGDVERRLAGEDERVAVSPLPRDEMGQEFAHGAAVSDEIVVDEINRAGEPAGAHLVEFGGDLRRRLEARRAAVERRDVAKIALIGAAARVLDAAGEITVEFRKLVGGEGEVGEVAPFARDEDDLLLGARGIARE